MSYAWIIDRDHLAEEFNETAPKGTNSNAPGVVGPGAAPDLMVQALEGNHELLPNWHSFIFRMYDDDGELYYTGRMITDEGETEEACFGPLDDFGMPNAGCTSIRYQGHPEMDC